MRTLIWLLLAGMSTFLFTSDHALATHGSGIDLSYRWVSGSQYEFTAVFYRNCQMSLTSPAPAPNTLSVDGQSSKFYNARGVLTRLATSGIGVPPLMPPNIFNCSADTAKCIEEYVYRGMINIPIKDHAWNFEIKLCCLPNGTNTQAQNLTGPTAQQPNVYTSCGLNNLHFPDTVHRNNGLFWHNKRPNHPGHLSDTVDNPMHISLCEGVAVALDQSVRNYDSDSIHYELITPKTDSVRDLVYINGFSKSTPLPLQSGGISIDSLTGIIRFTPGKPAGSGIYLLGIKATEYRNDTVVNAGIINVIPRRIGYSIRTLTIHLEDSATCPGIALGFIDTSGLAIDTGSIDCSSLSFNLKMSESFRCASLDTNGSCILILHPTSGDTIPIKRITPQGCTSDFLTSDMEVFLDSSIGPGQYELYFKTGNDGNTLLSGCHKEMVPFADTLKLSFSLSALGRFRGDSLAPTRYSPDIEVACNSPGFRLNLTEPVECSSVALDGSDFFIIKTTSGAPSVHRILGANPICEDGMTQSVWIDTDPMGSGTYALILKQGNDGNTITSYCHENWLVDSIMLKSLAPMANLGNDTVWCEEHGTISLVLSPGAFANYNWNTGDTTQSILVTDTGIYAVRVENEFGCFDMDSVVVDLVECYTGVSESAAIQLVKAYPNPFNEKLMVEWNSVEHMFLEIRNLLGEVVLQKSIVDQRCALNLEHLESGIYILKANSLSGQSVMKVLKK